MLLGVFRMHLLSVCTEFPSLFETHIASFEVANEGVLACMRKLMFLQVLRESKPFVTMFALMLLPLGMSKHMSLEREFAREFLLATVPVANEDLLLLSLLFRFLENVDVVVHFTREH